VIGIARRARAIALGALVLLVVAEIAAAALGPRGNSQPAQPQPPGFTQPAPPR
jgi:hypothetical protein